MKGGTVCQVCGVYISLARSGLAHLLTVERNTDTIYDLKLCIRCVDEAEGRIRAAVDEMLERV